MKNVFVLLIILLGLSTITSNAQNPVAQNTSLKIAEEKPLIQWNQMTNEFGEITQNIPAEATFKLTNNSDQPLLLKEVKPTCGCTIVSYDQEPILPGQSTTITTSYNAKKAGSFHKTIKVLTSLSEEYVYLKLRGTVIKGKS